MQQRFTSELRQGFESSAVAEVRVIKRREMRGTRRSFIVAYMIDN